MPKFALPPEPAAPVKPGAPALYTFIAPRDFSFAWNGTTLSFRSGQGYSVDAAQKAMLEMTDVPIVWPAAPAAPVTAPA